MRILVVEDEKALAQLVTDRLRREKYIVDVSYDGREGLDNALSGMYDLLILDIMLPGTDGITILKEVRKTDRDVKIIMLTAKSQIEKKYDKKYVEAALTYLEGRGYLSDLRFATAWLNTRKINHYEGRSRLAAELAARGIARDVASKALDEFFSENDEEEICRKAYEKLSKTKSDDKLIAALVRSGFPIYTQQVPIL